MDPYAKPNERKVGRQRPKISHLPSEIDKRTPKQRQVEKQAVAAQRRAIKKSARQDLRRKLLEELEEVDQSARAPIRTREGACAPQSSVLSAKSALEI